LKWIGIDDFLDFQIDVWNSDDCRIDDPFPVNCELYCGTLRRSVQGFLSIVYLQDHGMKNGTLETGSFIIGVF
jgi:hypothetical protein